MNIYFDFEATQFSERVLAIGATCEYGEFDCLVRPRKGDKLTKLITDLTGITREMLVNAPDAEEAFTDLYNWMGLMTNEIDTPIFYHCYGNSDIIFLINTASKMKEGWVKNFVLDLAESLIDDSRHVRKFFHNKSIGLHKALQYFEPDLPRQTHDPLDDAILLKRLMDYVEKAEPICEEEEIGPISIKKKKVIRTDSKTKYYIEARSIQNPEAKPKQFNDYRSAFDFCIRKIHKTLPNANPKTMEKNCKKAIDNGTPYLGRMWKKIVI